MERASAYAQAQGWTVKAAYADEGVSGALPLAERPQGRHLLTEEADVVIVWALDRFTRSARTGLIDLEALEAAGKDIVFVKEAVDTSTPAGRLFRTLLAAFAEFERETILERNMSGRYAKARRGDWPSGPPPYGYEWSPEEQRLQPREDEALAIKKVFQWRSEGLSSYAIAKRLHLDGHRSRAGGRITGASVRYWLMQPVYRGLDYVINIAPSASADQEAFRFEAEPLVSKETWNAAQAVPKRPVSRRRPYALTDRIFHNDTLLWGRWMKASKHPRRYWCSEGDGDGSCPGFGINPSNHLPKTSISADRVEKAVLALILDALERPGALSDALSDEEPDSGPDTPLEDESALQEALRGLDTKRERWLETYAEGLITKEERDRRLRQLAADEEDLEQRLREYLRNEAQPTPQDLWDAIWGSTPRGEGRDPHADDLGPPGSGFWMHEMSRALSMDPFPEWAIEELTDLAGALDLRVDLHRGEGDTTEAIVSGHLLGRSILWRILGDRK